MSIEDNYPEGTYPEGAEHRIQLGKLTEYSDSYDASLLVPIPRAQTRAVLPVSTFEGKDVWTAYELSWLNRKGVPQVAMAEFVFDAASANIVESKSFKYYLNSFNQTHFDDWQNVCDLMITDLSRVSGKKVGVTLTPLNEVESIDNSIPGTCVDNIDCHIEVYQPSAELLQFGSDSVVDEQLFSHLLKSNCPVTGQPDWATVWIQYSGAKLERESFLKYIVAFRQYDGFHESCVERIFSDLMLKGNVKDLCIYARYTRRGGLDINPIRHSSTRGDGTMPFGRLARQ